MIQKEFELEGSTYRVNMNNIEMLSLGTCINFDDIKKNASMYEFILEHTEVKIANSFVKVKNKDVYMPIGIENDLAKLQKICLHIIEKVVMPLFMKSDASKQEQK